MHFIKAIDFFPKVNEGVDVKRTEKGGMIFAIFAAIMVSLIFVEIYEIISGDPHVQPYIQDTDLEDKTRVNLNISIYEVPCEAITMDF